MRRLMRFFFVRLNLSFESIAFQGWLTTSELDALIGGLNLSCESIAFQGEEN